MIEMNIIIAFLTIFILLIILRPLAIKFNLVDYPTNRKTNTGNSPFVGEIFVFLGLLISNFFLLNLINFLVYF
jgi:UDP-GlcNAc:undecaprenyl-phosphate/decaprenyl-phosphate GlcNAc-1-phosphate transferase